MLCPKVPSFFSLLLHLLLLLLLLLHKMAGFICNWWVRAGWSVGERGVVAGPALSQALLQWVKWGLLYLPLAEPHHCWHSSTRHKMWISSAYCIEYMSHYHDVCSGGNISPIRRLKLKWDGIKEAKHDQIGWGLNLRGLRACHSTVILINLCIAAYTAERL